MSHEVVVPGSPEEVWDAVATGPGLTSWFVPCTVDGDTVVQDFGGGAVVGATVTRREPPHVFAFGDREFHIEARPGGTCVVRAGEDLLNLRLHLTHFPGEECHVVQASGRTSLAAITGALGLPAAMAEDDWVAAHAAGGPHFGGRVVHVSPTGVALLTDLPAPGIVLLRERGPEVSLQGYFRGPTGIDAATAGRTAWTSWLAGLPVR